MKKDIFDYIILIQSSPSFDANNAIIADNITDSGGTSPTIVSRAMAPMVGGKESNGRQMLHFRLNQRLNEAEVIDFLNQGTELPRSPISVESIRSAYPIIFVEDGTDPETGEPIGHYEYETLIQAMRAKFQPYLVEKTDEDGNPTGNFNNFLSCYSGTTPIELL